MKHGRINIIVVCICLLYSGLTGCKTTRNSIGLDYGINEESLKERLKTKKIDAKTIWIKKYNCEIRENWSRKEFYGDIKIVKGERMSITVKSGIGIETARVLLTKDSVKIIDRMKKEIVCGGYKQMKRYFGLMDSYKKAEDLLVNNNTMVIEEMEKNYGNRYDIKSGEKRNEIIIYEKGVKKRKKRFTVGMNNNSVVEYMEKNGESEMLKVAYLRWKDVEKIELPEELKIEIHKRGVRNIAIIKFEKVEINKQINTKLHIPDGYKVINL